MNVVKCVNGHFFDSDTYQNCPHCGGMLSAAPQSAPAQEKPKKKGLFGGWKKSSNSAPATSVPSGGYQPTVQTAPPEKAAFTEKTDAMPVNETPSPSVPSEIPVTVSDSPAVQQAPEVHTSDHTLDFWQNGNESSSDTEKQNAPVHSSNVSSGAPAVHSQNAAPSGAPAVNTSEPRNVETSSLSQAIKNASANSEGKTASYFSAVTAGNSSAANTGSGSAAPVQQVSTEPVVGWLVCIEGPYFGAAFNISAGKNSVGRGASNNIILGSDSAVSREKHASIVFEPKKRNFFIQPGDSSGLTYLNDEYITESTKLNARDIIELGSTKLLFVPLCDETFTWDDYIPKEK